MIVAEFTLNYRILRNALERTEGVRLDWERSDLAGEDVTILAWAGGGDLDAFETALTDDLSVRDVREVAAVGDRRLYQFTLADVGRDVSVYPATVDAGGIIRRATADADGWHLRVAFPDRGSVLSFREFCRSHDVDLSLRTLLVEETATDADRYGLTARQRDVLRVALDTGYFDIPRSASLADVADDLDISANAASERLRRGMRGLLAETVAKRDDESGPER